MKYAIVKYETQTELWRFKTQKERDEFVAARDNTESIKAKEAKKQYPDQFKFWN